MRVYSWPAEVDLAAMRTMQSKSYFLGVAILTFHFI